MQLATRPMLVAEIEIQIKQPLSNGFSVLVI